MNFLSGLSRRDFMKLSAAGVGGAAMSGWLSVLAARAASSGAKHKACILLWMDGGPSHKDTFDLKPGTTDAGEFKPIQTAAPGVEISENFPQFARLTNDAAIIRGMSTSEGAHGRARYYMHTGYKEGSGGLVYPSIGSTVSQELGKENFPLPNFVAVNGRSYGSGYLGPKHQPLFVQDPTKGVENLKPLVKDGEFNDRVGLLDEMEQAFYHDYKVGAGTAHAPCHDLSPRRADDEVERGQGVRPVRRAAQGQRGLRRQQIRRRLPAGQAASGDGRPLRGSHARRLGHP